MVAVASYQIGNIGRLFFFYCHKGIGSAMERSRSSAGAQLPFRLLAFGSAVPGLRGFGCLGFGARWGKAALGSRSRMLGFPLVWVLGFGSFSFA